MSIKYNEPFVMVPDRLISQQDISFTAKVLYAIIYASSGSVGILTNTYLSRRLNISERQLTRLLKELKDNHYIECKDDKKNHRRDITPLFTFNVSIYSSVNYVPDNSIEEDYRRELEELENPNNINFIKSYGRYGNVKLKNGEYAILRSKYGDFVLNHYIEVLDEKIELNNLKVKNFNSYLINLLENGYYDKVHLQYPKTLTDTDNGGFTEI